jgi:hypothetical protein
MTLIQRIATRLRRPNDSDSRQAADLVIRINEASSEDERWQIAREANLRRRFGAA